MHNIVERRLSCRDHTRDSFLPLQALPKFQLVEEYSGMLMTGAEIDSHNSHASRDGIAGAAGFVASTAQPNLPGLQKVPHLLQDVFCYKKAQVVTSIRSSVGSCMLFDSIRLQLLTVRYSRQFWCISYGFFADGVLFCSASFQTIELIILRLPLSLLSFSK